MNCPDCGSEMIQGFTSSYCKAECDLKIEPQGSKYELVGVWYNFAWDSHDHKKIARNGFVPDNGQGFWWFDKSRDNDDYKNQYYVSKENIIEEKSSTWRYAVKADSYLHSNERGE